MPFGRSPAFYRGVARETADPATALAAARQETIGRPMTADGWHRRAAAATALYGQPNAEAIASLTVAFDLAPYPAPGTMTWRVDYAIRHWAALPDPLGRRILTQIPAVAAIPGTYDVRRSWCRTAPPGALAQAACATVPRVRRNAAMTPDGATDDGTQR